MATIRAAKAHPSWTIPRPGDVVAGKYRVLEVLGQGGLAVVLAAVHELLEDRVALKVLRPEWSDKPEVVRRFLQEGRAATKIHSEHVVRVHDVGETAEGAPYFVMEYLEGDDLDTVLAKTGPLDVQTAVDYVAQACEAMAEVHAASIIHRDLKPANLFLTHRADGSACIKVIDFGISKIAKGATEQPCVTNPEAVMGSPHYMSPEQLQSATEADERSDVWALGAVLHELLSGSPPFEGRNEVEICVNVLRDAPAPLSAVRPDLPPGLEATVLVALEKDPAARFGNVAELALALASHGSQAAHDSAECAVRVLQLAGIIRPSVGSGGLWMAASARPASKPGAVPAPQSSAPGAASDTTGFRVKKSHPALIAAGVMTLFAAGAVGAVFMFTQPSPGASVPVVAAAVTATMTATPPVPPTPAVSNAPVASARPPTAASATGAVASATAPRPAERPATPVARRAAAMYWQRPAPRPTAGPYDSPTDMPPPAPVPPRVKAPTDDELFQERK